MMTMKESAARHMAARVMDLYELARLVEVDTGKAPSERPLRECRAAFRRHGVTWIEVVREQARETKRRSRSRNPTRSDEVNRRWFAANPGRWLLLRSRFNSKQRGFGTALIDDEVEALLAPMVCSVTNLPLTWEYDGESRSNPWAPSLDRIDSSKGYDSSNVRVVCWAFNAMRSDFPDNVVQALADAVLNPLMPDPTRRADPTARVHGSQPASHLLRNCRGSAKQRGQECTITAEDIEAMLKPMTCAATGLPLTWKRDGGGSTRANPWAPSIDRIDCALGYVPGNVRVVCWAFNQMRGDFPDEVVRTLAEAIVSRRPAP